ncbi:unnamed protein product (macronuclear) [Paramecium tetraurelia]|uniref:Uncharacterized protein n=1 Tax=Paramecium tetraurelia TaxID=5888 RepID=A0E3D2_PARTE|nr:uncharacterized protein GSPATT00022972001 [Paramecium tetraurelia]CAK89799.1 unnamed protein product [Paramecium tetraurelia]|eukprot:XP_001457196.1 hypothetical protein (macronuclear) [Paramecium tetraurelia strain d4-2]
MSDDVIVKKIKLNLGSYVMPQDEFKMDSKSLMQTEAQRIFNQYSNVVKEEKKLQAFNQITQQTSGFIKRLEEHRQILKTQIELQLKICQGNILLQRALSGVDIKK